MPQIRCRVLNPLASNQVEWLSDAFVAWDQSGRLTELAAFDSAKHKDAEDLRPGVLTPGFVDSHIHYPQTRVIGSATGPLLPWLKNTIFPEEARFKDPSHARRVAKMFGQALASQGTTLAVVYGPVFPEAMDGFFEVFAERGQRAIAGPVLMDADCPDSLKHSWGESEQGLLALKERWHQFDDGRLELAVIPRFALSCQPETLKAAGEFAATHGLRVTTHVSENRDECHLACERFGQADYLAVYEHYGLLQESSIYAHCVHFSDSEWLRFKEAGAIVAHCPDSNFFLGSGHMPLGTVLKHEIPLTIGSDVGAGRSFSMLRHLSAVYDNAQTLFLKLDPRQLFWWVTAGATRALGLPQLGQIAVGAEADLVLHDVPAWLDSEAQVLSWLTLNRDVPEVLKTWVRGRCVWDSSAGRWWAHDY